MCSMVCGSSELKFCCVIRRWRWREAGWWAGGRRGREVIMTVHSRGSSSLKFHRDVDVAADLTSVLLFRSIPLCLSGFMTVCGSLCMYLSLCCFVCLAVSVCCLWTCVRKRTTVWVKKNPPWDFLAFFPKRSGIFCPNFTRLLYVPIYARLQIFI